MTTRRRGLLAVAFVSGAAALVYQVVWLRWFQVLFGSTAYAASATLAAFFAGLALGAHLFGGVAGRTRRPLVVYAGLEVAAAGLALAVPAVFRLYDPLYAALYEALADRRWAFVALKFGLAALVMLPPATLIGGTLPLLATAFVRDVRALGSAGGLLYAVNTLGAAAGSAAGALWLPDAIGVPATYAVGLALAGIAAAGALVLARDVAAPEAPRASPSPRAPLYLAALAFGSGFATLAFEILLIQALAQIFSHSVYSYGAVLVVVLVALALGAALVAASEGRVAARSLLAGALTAQAVLLLVLPGAIARVGHTVEGAAPGSLGYGLALAVLLGGPPLLAGALVLPLTFRFAAGGAVGPRIGGLLAANTVGGILGSLAGSFAFQGALGLWRSLALLGLAYGAAALAVPGGSRSRAGRAVVLGAAAAAVLALANPWRIPPVRMSAGHQLVDVEQSAYGVVSVVQGRESLQLRIDNHYILSGAGPYPHRNERPGHIPLLLHPDPKRVVFVGSATGIAAGAAVAHPVERIVLVELVPQVQALAARHFEAPSHGVHHDPRTRLVVEDGRNHLRATRESYDVIVADLFPPWQPGVGGLYTREHFEAARRRLSPGGVFCQWLPAYQHDQATFESVAATFLDVFPDAVVWRADFYARMPVVGLVGFAGASPSVAAVERRVRDLAARGVQDRWVTDPRGFWMLQVGPLSRAREQLSRVPRNSDAHPRFEYLAGRSSNEERRRFVRVGWPAFAEQLSAGDGAGPFARRMDWAREGGALVRAAVLRNDGRREDSQRLLSELAARLPAELLSPPDPSVSELWRE